MFPLLRMNDVGIVAFFSIVFLLLHRYRSLPRPYSFPRLGYLGAGILIAGEYLMFQGFEPVATYFTPLAWTGYILWADGAIFALRGKSPIKTYPVEFLFLALCSIPLWLILWGCRRTGWRASSATPGRSRPSGRASSKRQPCCAPWSGTYRAGTRWITRIPNSPGAWPASV